jgi:hypothetical protein
MEINLKEFNSKTNWIKGTIDDYNFEAKHFDVGSEFGINNGRVSKLSIWKGDNRDDGLITHYERGWDVKPKTKEQKEVYQTLLDYLEQLPKRFE